MYGGCNCTGHSEHGGGNAVDLNVHSGQGDRFATSVELAKNFCRVLSGDAEIVNALNSIGYDNVEYRSNYPVTHFHANNGSSC